MEKMKQNESVEENYILKTCLLACYFSYPMKNKQNQVSINTFPRFFPFSSKPACGIIISAMVYICIYGFLMNPVCKLTEAFV